MSHRFIQRASLREGRTGEVAVVRRLDLCLAAGLRRLDAVPAEGIATPDLASCLDACQGYFRAVEGHPADPDRASAMIADALADESRKLWLLSSRESKGPVGALDVHLNHPVPREATIALLLLVPSQRGQGLGREVVRALLAAIAREGFEAVRLAADVEAEGANDFWRAVGMWDAGRRGRTHFFEKALGPSFHGGKRA